MPAVSHDEASHLLVPQHVRPVVHRTPAPVPQALSDLFESLTVQRKLYGVGNRGDQQLLARKNFARENVIIARLPRLPYNVLAHGVDDQLVVRVPGHFKLAERSAVPRSVAGSATPEYFAVKLYLYVFISHYFFLGVAVTVRADEVVR